MDTDKTLYSILQVSEDASDEVIKAAYLALIKKYHPDSNLAFRNEATTITEELNHAYSVLSNHVERSSYDARLREYKNTNSAFACKSTGSVKKIAAARNFSTFALFGCMTIIFLAILLSSLKSRHIVSSNLPSNSENNYYDNVKSDLLSSSETECTISQEYQVNPIPVHGYFLKGGNNITYHDNYVGGITDDELYAPFKIEPPEDNIFYLLKIKNIWNPDIEYQIFVHGGQPPIEVNLLCGTYILSYAIGSVWYGTNDLFGNETHYYRADGSFKFYHDGHTACGNTLTLYKVPNGNLDFKEISSEEF